MTPLRIFIGFDHREAAAYHVLCHSILKHASCPVSITPLVQSQLRQSGLYSREPDVLASTEFSLTRFLVPYLSGYQGYSLFLDCDILCQHDIADLFAIGLDRPEFACHVVKHDYTPSTVRKMDGQQQTVYPRKNWSSVILFNNALCTALSPEYVNHASTAALHRFAWTNDYMIGDLHASWNWLVGEYVQNTEAMLLHYTLGGPWFGINHGEASQLWIQAHAALQEDLRYG